jgi:proteasome accessory factor B
MTTDATERIVNLALFLASARHPVSAAEIASHVPGYPEGQSAEAFGRMFERDKDDLRAAGLVVTLDRDADVERYRIDEMATFSGTIELTPLEAVELRTAAAVMLSDDSFPFTGELRTAVAKVVAAARTPAGHGSAILASPSADEAPEAQGDAVAVLTSAATARKRVRFGYTGAGGRGSRREVEPWGLFARDGRWYLVAFDPEIEEARVFAVLRMSDLTVAARPKTPDFERPDGFDVASYVLMPFQYGPCAVEAVLRFTGAAALRMQTLTAGQGAIEAHANGSVTWRVPIASEELLARWVVASGPGIRPLEPATLVARVRDGLSEVVRLHG